MVQPAEGASVELPAELARRRVDARRQRARGHHVHRAREAVLRQHLTARMEQQRQLGARVVDEPLERRLDPRLHHGHLHQATSPDRHGEQLADRPEQLDANEPDVRRRLGDDDEHEIAPADRAQIGRRAPRAA